MQIVAGSLVLAACSALHLVLLVGAVKWLGAIGVGAARDSYLLRIAKLMGGGFAAVVLAHSAHVWSGRGPSPRPARCRIWPTPSTSPSSPTPRSATAMSSSTAAYRIFGAMEAVTGLLSFGISTAFLVGIFGRLLKDGG